MDHTTQKARWELIASVVLFGTIGLFVAGIPLPRAAVAAVRGLVGALLLFLFLRLRGQKLQIKLLRPKLGWLIVSGVVMGFNWILLFESFRFAGVAVGTLCYYFAPSIMVVASAVLYREKLTLLTVACVLVALGGMALASGVLQTDFSGGRGLIGVALGLGAAVLYATVILINKSLHDVPSRDGTVVQLFCAGAATAVYLILTEDVSAFDFGGAKGIALLAAVALLHTGLAYALYFDSIPRLTGATVAMLSYLDPVIAVLLGALVLHETMHPLQWVGAVLIIGSSLVCELGRTKEKTT